MTNNSKHQRLHELDSAKFIAMLFMIVGHALDALVLPDQLDVARPPWSIWHWWRGITAPVFLTISGILFSLTLQRSQDGKVNRTILRRRIARAGKLMFIGYLLVFPAGRLFDVLFISSDQWRVFFQVNILQLVSAGLILLVLLAGLVRNTRNFQYGVCAFGVSIAILTPFVHQVRWFDYVPEFIASYLSYEHGSLFPVFPFASFMFIGAWLGAVLAAHDGDKVEVLHRYALRIGLALIAIGLFVDRVMPLPGVDIYRYTPIGVAIRQGVSLVFIVLVSYLMPVLRRYESLLVLFGKQALAIYVIHLILIFGTPWFNSIGRIYYKSLPLWGGIVAAILLVVLTLSSIILVQRLRVYLVRPVILRLVRIGVYVLLAYLLLV